jgi:hypothetical protein
MVPICVRVLIGVVALVLLSSCSAGPNFIVTKGPELTEEEKSCLASGTIHATGFIRTKASLGGPSACGAVQPFEMTAADNGRVILNPPALLRCPMIPQVDRWVVEVIEPAARHTYGASLAEITVLGSYACRPINHVSGSYLSEHGRANALDISAFTLSDGTRISVKRGWRGDRRQQAFLREVHDGACARFSTVLGPDYNSLHRDHFHVDLAYRGPDGLRTVCK